MARAHTVLAVGLIVLGMVAMSGPTFGFSTIASDRGVSVVTAADQKEAFVGLEEIHENGINNRDNGREPVVRISNNLDGRMELETDIRDLTNLEIADGFDDELAVGDATELTLECGTGEGTERFVVEVTEASVDERSIEIEGASIEVSIDHDCPGQETGDLTVSDPTTGDTGAELEFTLENTDDETEVDIDRISLDETTADATVVDNGGDPEIRIGEEDINTDGEIRIDGVEQNIQPRPTVDPNGEITVEVAEFRDGGEPISLAGETVSITIYYHVPAGDVSKSFEIEVPDD